MRKGIKKLLTDDVLTANEVAELLGIDRTGPIHYLRRGTLQGVLKGKTWLFDRREVEQLIKRRGRVKRLTGLF